jgi:putative endonuclease
MAKHLEQGKKGEELALQYLKSLGYQILELNWRFSRAEIDLIAKENDTLVFVEVKTRSSSSYGMPEEFVNEHKEALLLDAAGVYAESIGHEWSVRFDLITLIGSDNNFELQHFKDVFYPEW